MNTRNEWKVVLKNANESLKKYGISIDVNDDDEEGFFECNIFKNGEIVETYAENYYEDELDDLINDAWDYAMSNYGA